MNWAHISATRPSPAIVAEASRTWLRYRADQFCPRSSTITPVIDTTEISSSISTARRAGPALPGDAVAAEAAPDDGSCAAAATPGASCSDSPGRSWAGSGPSAGKASCCADDSARGRTRATSSMVSTRVPAKTATAEKRMPLIARCMARGTCSARAAVPISPPITEPRLHRACMELRIERPMARWTSRACAF